MEVTDPLQQKKIEVFWLACGSNKLYFKASTNHLVKHEKLHGVDVTEKCSAQEKLEVDPLTVKKLACDSPQKISTFRI